MKWSKGEGFRITGLYLLIIPFLNALNATGYVNPQIQGHFGASGTEFMYMNLVPVFTLIVGLPLALELTKQFPLRSLMFTITMIAIGLNTCSAYTDSIFWYTFFRSMLAFVTIFGIVAAIAPIAMRYNPAFNMAIMYGIIQFIIQGSSHLYKFLGAHFAQVYDWRTSLLLLNINFFLCIILTWIFLRKNVAPFKKPFQFDFKGWFILLVFLALLLFLSAEGQNREWFSDPGVMMATAGLLMVAGAYVLYSQNAKAPLIDLDVYRYRNVVFGTLLFFLIGIMNNTGTVIMGFMSGLLGFSEMYIAQTHLYTGIGLLISIPVCTYMLFHRVYLRFAAIAGFLSFTMYHALMYFRFYPGISENDFIVPLVFKGMGIGFLYVLSSLYISENIPKHLSGSRMMSGILARNVIAMLLGAAVLSTFITRLNVQHKTGISQQLTTLNPDAALQYRNAQVAYRAMGMSPVEADQMAYKSLQQEMAESAMLLSYKDIYLAMSVICLMPVLLILAFRFGNRPVRAVNVEPIPI